jgi:hypothetical protein
LEVEKREDMFDIRFAILRLASIIAIFMLGSEFMHEPENFENLMSGSGEIWNEVFEWGQNKFLGVPDNSTAIQLKKSARQIYAEAFMEDEQNSAFGMGNKRVYQDVVEPPRPSKEDLMAEEEEDLNNEENLDEYEIAVEAESEYDDPLDRLTSNEEL